MNFMNLKLWISHKRALYGWASLILLLLIYAVIGERGAIHLWRLEGEKSRLDEQNYRLQKANEALREKITRLRNDDFYLEKIAREELNLVRPGDVVYRFPVLQSEAGQSRTLSGSGAESRPSKEQKSRR
jgi:cell division protein FtsB